MKHAKGFTLLEVLIALVVVAISLSALIFSISENVRNIAYLEDKATATWVAGNVLAELRLGIIRPPNVSYHFSGTEVMLGKTWYWKVRSKSIDLREAKRIEVSVGYNKDNSLVNLTSFVWTAK